MKKRGTRAGNQHPTKEKKARILVVEDHPIVRHGLAQLINHEADLLVCGEADDAPKALEAIAALRPDMVIVDISLKGGDGIELVKNIRGRYGRMPVLVLSMHEDLVYGERALRAGANGYIMKEEGTEKVVTAIRKILSGGVYVSDRIAGRLIRRIVDRPADIGESPIAHLSDRELEVFRLIGRGYKTRQIADLLGISVKTVESYRAHIKEKLSLKDAAELLRYAIQWVQSEQLG